MTRRIPKAILERVRYEPTAKFGLVWVKPRFPGMIGKPTGSYIRDAEGFCYHAHRIVWALHYGDPGDYQIDHVDRNRKNNRIENLRLATYPQNQCNRTNFSGKSIYKGVGKHANGRWRARINGDVIGYFDTETDAALAYNEVALKLHGEFAVLNNVK